jgi:peptidyl-prolyl cis-trans isomerase B (cyclophilin B)
MNGLIWLVSIIFSLIPAITGIVLGSIALKQIKRTPQGRRGMAIAGIAIGVGTLLAYMITIIVAIIVAK